MGIEKGRYCQYCADEKGNLKPFEALFSRMVDWAIKNDGKLDRASAERNTLKHMSTLPAWKDHPRVVAAQQS